MDKTPVNNDELTIDLLHIIKVLWKRAWIIALAILLAGSIGFSVAAFGIPPKYSASVMLYVNNGFSFEDIISSSQIVGARSLLETYAVILKSRTTLDEVIEKADVPYTASQLSDMIQAESVNGTEVMRVTVTSEDPYEAAEIANTIAVVLPKRIGVVIEGSTMEVVDSAIVDTQKVSPSITRYTAIGMLLGMIASMAVIVVIDLMDGTVRGEEYILQNYDCPVLAKIPDFSSTDSKPYGYYYQTKRAEK
ncbi:MAG: YveK family protein [Eubacteriales bacterium]